MARSSAGGALFAILSVNWSDVSDIASLLSHFADQIGRPVTGPYRALDGRRQPRGGPIAGEQEIVPTRMRPRAFCVLARQGGEGLSLIHISEPTRRTPISYAVFCLKKKQIQRK